MAERVQIFTENEGRNDGSGNFRWGWQCFDCGDEETRFGNATTAREAADNHAATCVPSERDRGTT